LNIDKNSNGYYEIEFKNSHIMIYIPERKLFVDKYEVSNSQYLKFARENNKEIIPIHFSTLKGYPRSCLEYPAIVSYDEAEAYCSVNGLRLPKEEEWEVIAGKDKGYKYSWGNLEIDDSGKYRSNFESLEDGYIEVAPIKSFENYPSPFGAVNIMGNVSEWVKGKICKGGGYISEKEQLTFEFRSENCLRVGFRCVMDEIK
jgi:formylglycine-generating enzyme required for sulfatase activity